MLLTQQVPQHCLRMSGRNRGRRDRRVREHTQVALEIDRIGRRGLPGHCVISINPWIVVSIHCAVTHRNGAARCIDINYTVLYRAGRRLSFAVVTTKQDKRRNQQQSASEDPGMFQSAPPPFRAKLTGGLCGTRSDKSSEILAGECRPCESLFGVAYILG